MNPSLTVLVKREFWEHRSLWLAPLAAGGVLVLLMLLGWLLGKSPLQFDGPAKVDLDGDATPLMIAYAALLVQLSVVAAITTAIYLLDCLYAERKDRSILFWKSLPVSDARTVLVKYGVAMLVVPLGVLLLATLLYPVVFGLLSAGVPEFRELTGGWHFDQWFSALAGLSGAVLASLLWYAPIGAWLILASVIAKRAPLLVAVLPPVVLAVSENIVLGSSNLWQILGYRFSPQGDLLEVLTDLDLWLGLAVAAGMLYIVIRLRRYRDDT